MRSSTALAAALALTLAGCASSSFEGQEDLVEGQLDRCEEAGAPRAGRDEVRATMELAREMESRAEKDQAAARRDLAWAREESAAAHARLASLREESTTVRSELERARADLAALEQEREGLLGRGVTADQAMTLLGERRGLLERRIAMLEAREETLGRRIELATLDRVTAEDYARAAENRLQASRDRVALAGALYELASRRASLLEAEALLVRRGELSGRVATEPKPAPQPGSQPPPPPTTPIPHPPAS